MLSFVKIVYAEYLLKELRVSIGLTLQSNPRGAGHIQSWSVRRPGKTGFLTAENPEQSS